MWGIRGNWGKGKIKRKDEKRQIIVSYQKHFSYFLKAVLSSETFCTNGNALSQNYPIW